MTIELYTIGFAKKTAEQFFNLLQKNRVTVLVDTRLHPDSQLSGFAKGRDLPYLLRRLIACSYRYMGDMAPEDAILKQYRKDSDWEKYEMAFTTLLHSRNLIETLDRDWWQKQRACLLCSEHEPDFCHRRLVAEYIASHWDKTEIHHLM
jgi:uncharacterized protein (DUF488 family)